jgi:hypothetical protein
MQLMQHSWPSRLQRLLLPRNSVRQPKKPKPRGAKLRKRSARKRTRRLWLQLLMMLSARGLPKSKRESARLTRRRLTNSPERLLRRLQD